MINSYSLYLSAGNLISTYSRLASSPSSLTFKGEGNALTCTHNLTFDLATKFARDLKWNLSNNFEAEVEVSDTQEGSFTLTCPNLTFDL